MHEKSHLVYKSENPYLKQYEDDVKPVDSYIPDYSKLYSEEEFVFQPCKISTNIDEILKGYVL